MGTTSSKDASLAEKDQLSVEGRVLQKHHEEIHQAIAHPVDFARCLAREGLIDRNLVSEVGLRCDDKSFSQQKDTILEAVRVTIRRVPGQFQTLLSVLEENSDTALLARKMREGLSK